MLRSPKAEVPQVADEEELAQAILRTVIYSDMFAFPLKADEIHRFLIGGRPVTLEEVRRALESSSTLASSLSQVGGYYFLRTGSASLRDRLAKERSADEKWRTLRKRMWLFHCTPFIKMVAITGSLAVNSTDESSDVDMLLVCKKGRVYTSLMLFRILRRLRLFRGFCANLVLDESDLKFDDRNIFTARELVQSIPVYGKATHRALMQENSWTRRYFPSYSLDHCRNGWSKEPSRPVALVTSIFEGVFDRLVGNRLEVSHYRWNIKVRPPSRNGREHNVVIEPHRYKGHWVDHKGRILRDFESRLNGCGLGIDAGVLQDE